MALNSLHCAEVSLRNCSLTMRSAAELDEYLFSFGSAVFGWILNLKMLTLFSSRPEWSQKACLLSHGLLYDFWVSLFHRLQSVSRPPLLVLLISISEIGFRFSGYIFAIFNGFGCIFYQKDQGEEVHLTGWNFGASKGSYCQKYL